MAILTPTSPLTGISRRHTPVATGGLPVSGAIIWLDASTPALTTTGSSYADGDPVTTWTDHSGHGNDLTSFTATAPKYYNNIWNGLGCIDFGGGSWPPTATTGMHKVFTLVQPFTYFTVGIIPILSGSVGVVDGCTLNTALLRTLSILENSIAYAGQVLTDNISQQGIAATIYTVVFNSTSSVLGFKGTAYPGPGSDIAYHEVTGDIGTAVPGGITLGVCGDGTTQPYMGTLHEFILYPSALSSGDRNTIVSYLSAKWQIAASLTP